MSQILVVSSNDVELFEVLGVLTAAGFDAWGASSFEQATRFLTDGAPDLIIADERLGEFNGLHVILRARADYPGVSAIVTTPGSNRGLEADARSLKVECLVKPRDPADWLEPIWKALNAERAAGWSAGAGTAHAVTRH